MIRPFLYLVGYCILSVAKEDRERFVNLCAARELCYHVVDVTSEHLRVRVSWVVAARLGIAAAAYGLNIKTEKRVGVPFLIGKMLKRGGIVAGLALSCLVIFLSGRVIWDVRIEGNDSVSAERIEQILGECGVFVGAQKESLDIDAIENRFLIISDEISWISVNIIGSVAEVEVREVAVAQPKPMYAASNLVATKNGTVVGFEQVRGNIAVTLGEAVSVGQLLVGGIYGSEGEALRLVRSSGSVFALCEQDFCISVPMKYDKKVYTGRKKIKKSLIFFEKEVKFFGNSRNLYASCDKIDVVEYFDPFGLGELPIGIRTVTYEEYEICPAQRSEDEAREQANYLLWKAFEEQSPEAEVVGKHIVARREGEEYLLEATVESIENIAKEIEIQLNLIE